MEKNLFDWCGWDLVTDTHLQFYGCTLKVPIGDFVVGALVPVIAVDFEHGSLRVYDKEKTLLSEHEVQLVLVN